MVRGLHVLRVYDAKYFADRKTADGYPTSVFKEFQNKPIFYIVRPPSCIRGFKPGSSRNGMSRLIHYEHAYGPGMTIKEVILFRKRDSSKAGSQPQEKFEQMVKNKLTALPRRGTEFFARLKDIQKAMKEVFTTFDAKYKESLQPIRGGKRGYVTPKVGMKVSVRYEDGKSYKGTIIKKLSNGFWDVKWSNGTTGDVQLIHQRFSRTHRKTGQWDYVK